MDSKQFLEVVEKYKAGFITLPDVMESLAVYTFGEVEKHGEQIAREIEERNSLIIKTSQSLLTPAEIVERCAAIARGQDEFPLVLDGRNDGSVIHAEDLRKTAREWRREK